MRTTEEKRRARILACMRLASREGCDPYNSHSAYAAHWTRLAQRFGWV